MDAKPEIQPVKRKPTIPQVDDIPYLRWLPTGIKISLKRRAKAAFKKPILTPIAKPLQWLIHLASEEFRQAYPGLVYAAAGFTPRATEQTLDYLYQEKPESPEIPYWQRVKAIHKVEKPPFTGLFEAYYEWDYLGKSAIKIPQLPESRLVKTLTFGKIKTPPQLKKKFWQLFKKTGIGKLISKGAGKIVLSLGKISATAAGPPGWAVNAILLAAEKVAKFVWHRILKPVVSRIARAIKKPEEAVGMVAVGAAIAVFISAPIGAAFIFIGALGLLSWGIASAGAITGGFATAVTAFFVLLTTAPITAPIALFVVGVLGTLAALTFFIVMTTAGAFIVPVVPTAEAPFASPYIGVLKTVAPKSQFANDELPVEITYTLTVVAKSQKLINVRIVDQTTVTKEENPPSVPDRTWQVNEITTSWTKTYNLTLDNRFENSLITNIATVTADVEGGPSNETASASLIVVVGSPPEDCPAGWPTTHGWVGQGPNTPLRLEDWCTSHAGDEAIDIEVGVGTPVYATHRGMASSGYSSGGGKYVAISGLCNGQAFISYYYHLSSIDPGVGGKVTRGIEIGRSGNTGTKSTGPHLDYRLVGLPINPYLPQSVPQGCCEVCGSCHDEPCGVNW